MSSIIRNLVFANMKKHNEAAIEHSENKPPDKQKKDEDTDGLKKDACDEHMKRSIEDMFTALEVLINKLILLLGPPTMQDQHVDSSDKESISGATTVDMGVTSGSQRRKQIYKDVCDEAITEEDDSNSERVYSPSDEIEGENDFDSKRVYSPSDEIGEENGFDSGRVYSPSDEIEGENDFDSKRVYSPSDEIGEELGGNEGEGL